MTGAGADADADPAEASERYRAAVAMAEYADRNGFAAVTLEEHHLAENGWLPSPLPLAGAILARTETIRVTIVALLVTLYDPVRLAEDIAVLDLLGRGRLSFVAGMGYRPDEYHAVGKRWEDRGRAMDETIDTLLKAWSGKPFRYKGRTIRVTPVPFSRPHPFFFIGGMSKTAARRAAGFGLPFYPPMTRPDLEAAYNAELERTGNSGFVYHPGEGNSMLFVDHDPEAAWKELAPYFLRELREYASWKSAGIRRPSEQDVSTVEELRAQGRFTILTPEQCRDRLEQSDAAAVLHPLAGGVPIERAWQSLRLFTEEVLRPARERAAAAR